MKVIRSRGRLRRRHETFAPAALITSDGLERNVVGWGVTESSHLTLVTILGGDPEEYLI